MLRIALLISTGIFLGFAQNPLKTFTFGGSGSDSANGVAVDSAGNIYVAGSTSSFDLPVMNAFQPANSGTQVIYSQDAGATWKPLVNPFPAGTGTVPIAVDPANAQIVYIGSPTASSVCTSNDGGAHFLCVNLSSTCGGILSLAVDPVQPATLYATASPPSSTVPGCVFKSTDGAATWVSATQGLPADAYASPLTIDPFHHNVLYVLTGNGAYVSQDGAATWTQSSLPLPAGFNTLASITFDPVTPGILYGPASIPNANPTIAPSMGIQKSVDSGKTWTLLSTPFSPCCVVPDPKTPGVLYSLTSFPTTLWKSTDGGVSWNSSMVPPGATGPLIIDPGNPLILLAGAYRSADGGQTWTATNASRAILPVFAPAATNTVYATAPITSDAFLAKFLPDGKTLVFLTYFGGMGNDGAQSIALDGAGNIWIAGHTSSFDLPMTAGAFQSSLNGSSNGFIAKFSNDGTLSAASYLGGSSRDSILGIALSPTGNPWVIGTWTSSDFPFSTGPVGLTSYTMNAFVSELDAALAHAPYVAPVDGSFDPGGKGIAIDSSGNVFLTGSTYDPNFPLTAGIYHAGVPGANTPEAFLLKLDPNGQTIYSTYIGGTQGTPAMVTLGLNIEGPLEHGVAVATDSAGNAVVAGYTASADFPTTPGAYQTSIASGCAYPAFTIGTLGPTEFSYLVDDIFVLKLSADGKTLQYSTLLGGSCYDRATGIALDAAGNAYVTGETDSGDYPLVGAVEPAPPLAQYSSFVSVLNSTGTGLMFSSYLLAGANPAIAVAPGSSIVIAGEVGAGAQTQEFISPFGPPPILTHAYLAILTPPQVAPPVNLSQVRNAFSLQAGPVAPGEIISLGLPGFVPEQFADIGLNALAPLTTNLGGVQVLFDGRPAYLITVDRGKVVCIAPAEIAGQASTAIQVSVNGVMSNFLNAPVSATALGLLTADESGMGLANARNSDGTLNRKNNPAAAGTTVTIFLTGAGVTTPAEPDGVVPASSSIAPTATISGTNVTPMSIHALPGFVPGIFGLDFVVPANVPAVLGVMVSSETSQSQFVNVYVK